MANVLLVGGPADLDGDIIAVDPWPQTSVWVTALDGLAYNYVVDEFDLVEPYTANFFTPNDLNTDPDQQPAEGYVAVGERGERGGLGPLGPQGVAGTNGVGMTIGAWANIPGATPPPGGQQAQIRYLGSPTSILEFRGEFEGSVAAFTVDVAGMGSTAYVMFALRSGTNYAASGLMKITSFGEVTGLAAGAGQVAVLNGVSVGLRL